MIVPGDGAAQRIRLLQKTNHHPHAVPQRLVSLGSWISAAVTVLSTRTTLPLSNLSCRTLASSILLTASHVSARIGLIVLCKTDFFRLHPHGSRAKARNEAESCR